LGIGTDSLKIVENQTYNLYENIPGNATAVYSYATNGNYTSHTYTGELKITKLDFEHNIVSGTFWFDVKDGNGVVHHIRKRRFDMRFTQ